MTTPPFDAPPRSPTASTEDAVRLPRILAAALALGMAMYVVVLLTLIPSPVPAAHNRMMALIVAPVWMVGLLCSVTVPRAMARSARRAHEHTPLDEPALTSRWKTVSIARMAYLEGPGLMGAVMYQVTGEWGTLLAPALSIFILLVGMPSAGGYQRFREEVTGIRNY